MCFGVVVVVVVVVFVFVLFLFLWLLWLFCCCCFCFVVVVVVVEWLYYSKRIIIVRWADLSDFVYSSIFVGKMCVFVSRPMKIATFPRKNDVPPKTGC